MHGLCKTFGRKLKLFLLLLLRNSHNEHFHVYLSRFFFCVFTHVLRHTRDIFTEVGSFYIKFRGLLSFA